MARPWLTIDFKGLCAFVTDTKDPDHATKLHVVMVDTDKAAPKEDLCRHDPMVVFRGDEDFLQAGKATDHGSFSSLDEEDFGFWKVAGKDLTLEHVDPKTQEPLEIDKSFSRVLSFSAINDRDGEVEPKCIEQPNFPGVGARLTLDHGRVSACRWSDSWALAPRDGKPDPQDFMRFRQVVRWRVFAKPTSQAVHFRLSAGKDEWIQLKHRAHVVICNLCPLAPGGGPAEDLLAYYAFCKHPVQEDKRYVLHPKPQVTGFAGAGYPVRPGVDACPPLAGYLGS